MRRMGDQVDIDKLGETGQAVLSGGRELQDRTHKIGRMHRAAIRGGEKRYSAPVERWKT